MQNVRLAESSTRKSRSSSSSESDGGDEMKGQSRQGNPNPARQISHPKTPTSQDRTDRLIEGPAENGRHVKVSGGSLTFDRPGTNFTNNFLQFYKFIITMEEDQP